MSNEIKCPHCGEAFTVDESGYAAILNQVRDQEFQREVDARVSLAEKSREQEVALAVTKAEEALRAQIAERDGELVNLKAQLSVQQQQASMETQIAVQRAEAAAKDAQVAVERERDDLRGKVERARDELPQSGSGRTIMTAEPKFVPEEAVEIIHAAIYVDEGIKVTVEMEKAQ